MPCDGDMVLSNAWFGVGEKTITQTICDWKKSNYWLSPWAPPLLYFAHTQKKHRPRRLQFGQNTPASLCAAWRTQLNGDKLVVSRRRVFYAAGCLEACAPWIRAAVCLVWVFFSFFSRILPRHTRRWHVPEARVTNLQLASLCHRANASPILWEAVSSLRSISHLHCLGQGHTASL